MTDGFFTALAKAAPRIRTPLSLAGLVVTVAAFVITRNVKPDSIISQLAAGGIGIAIILFGQLLGALRTFPLQQRVNAVIALFLVFSLFSSYSFGS